MEETSIIEYIENMIGLAFNYLEHHSNKKLEILIQRLEKLEDEIEFCNNQRILRSINILQQIVDEMDVIVNG